MYRMMVVDDDVSTRDRIARYLRRIFPEVDCVETAADGNQAFALYEANQFDIIYTDIEMPRCDGLKLIARLHQSGYKPCVVVISGYDNFEYARVAMQLGVKEYLLKPVLPEQIQELTRRLLSELREQTVVLQEENAAARHDRAALLASRETFFQVLLQGDMDAQSLEQSAHAAGITLIGPPYMAALLRLSEKQSAGTGMENLLRLCAASGEMMKEPFHASVMLSGVNEIAFLMSAEGGARERLFAEANILLNRITRNAQKDFGLVVFASFGCCCNTLAELARSYGEARHVLRAAEAALVEAKPDGEVQHLKIDPVLEENLIGAVKYQTPRFCEKLADELAGQIAHCPGAGIEEMRGYYLELAALLLRELRRVCPPEEGFLLDYQTLLDANDEAACIRWFQTLITRVTAAYEQLNSRAGNSLVSRAKHIMHDNLSESAFSIDDVAAKLFISSNYLRCLFAQQSDGSFVEYLTRIRMEHSLRLLQNPELKIQEVAEQAGYSNQRYFAVCFKKYFGITPTEARDAPS